MQDHDVVGIGNAIVDIIAHCDDAFLSRHDQRKGSMQLVDEAAVARLYAAMGPAVEISGGSCANTMAGIASFGGKAGFIGKVARDQFGQVFGHDIRSAGVTFTTAPAAAGSDPTARCLILVTPDGQRTMNTFLGVSPQLGGGEIDAELIRSAKILYLEGYLFDRPEAKAAFGQAAEIAAKAKRQVALTLSDAFCVDRHRAEFRALVRGSVDILFANEAEITSLYQVNTFEEAAKQAAADTRLAVLTRSEAGSVILGEGRSDRHSRSTRRQGGRHHRRRRPLRRGLPLRHRHRPRPGSLRPPRQPRRGRDHLPPRRPPRGEPARPRQGARASRRSLVTRSFAPTGPPPPCGEGLGVGVNPQGRYSSVASPRPVRRADSAPNHPPRQGEGVPIAVRVKRTAPR